MADVDRRNVVLVSVDSLRADYCGFAGADRDTTPRLDGLLSDGVVYETAIAPGPRTPSSMPVAFTGRFPEAPGAGDGDWRARRRRIAAHLRRYETIPERLSDRGYATAGFTVNPWTTRDTGFDAGFDTFVQSPATDESWPLPVRAVDKLVRVTGNQDRFNWHNKQDWLAQWPQFRDRLSTLISGLAEPYFLWVFLLDTHQPYIAPSAYRKENTWPEMYYAAFQYWNHRYRGNREGLPAAVDRRLQRAYRDAIRSIDGFVGQLAETLDSADPAIVVHSDHGEAFGEHGTYGHQQTLYEENIRVPLAVIDGREAARIDAPVSLQALPEVVSAASRGSRLEPDAGFVTAETEDQSAVAVRGRRWRYVADEDGSQLFDLRGNPEECEEVTDAYPDVARALEDVVRRHRRRRVERRTVRATVDGLCWEGRL